MASSPDLKEALDGLQLAEKYCEDNGMDDIGQEIADCYRRVGKNAPDDHWEEP